MTMSLSDIARLAGVQRPVVSMWRTRYRNSSHPFPDPVRQRGDRGAVLFKEDDVRAWLEATGRGNNPDARTEQALHDDRPSRLLAALGRASALLLLQHLCGESLEDSTESALSDAVRSAGIPQQLLNPDLIASYLADRSLVADVEAMTEAAFSAENALTYLVSRAGSTHGSAGGHALAPAALPLMAAILREVHAAAELPLLPLNRQSLRLIALTPPRSDVDHPRHLVALPELLTTPEDRAAWRLLIAQGCHACTGASDAMSASVTLPTPGCLAVTVMDSSRDQSSAAQSLSTVLAKLGPMDRVIVLGPASLLIAAAGKAERLPLLKSADDSGIALRYAARLPKGLESTGGRRRLALWLLAGEDVVNDPDVTVLADHGDAVLDGPFCDALAADVATALSGSAADLRHRAFRAGGAVPASELRRRSELSPPSLGAEPPVLGGPLLTEALNSDPALFARLSPAAHPEPREQRRVSWSLLTTSFGKDRAGVRLPVSELGDSGAGTVAAIGPEELRGTRAWGCRRIHRLRLEQIAPRARFTEPGDVVYVAAGGPAALVDDVGGHLVLAPARIFRPGPAVRSEQTVWAALPQIVAKDITDQRVPDKDAWRIRLSPAARGPDVARVHQEVARRRRALQDELTGLETAERALLDALAAGVLQLDGRGTNSTTIRQDDAAFAAKEEV